MLNPVKGQAYLDRYIGALKDAGYPDVDTDCFVKSVVASCYADQHIHDYAAIERNLHAYGSTVESFSISYDVVCDYLYEVFRSTDMEISDYMSVCTIRITDESRYRGNEIIKKAITRYKRKYAKTV